MKKYEFAVLKTVSGLATEKMLALQDQGWELAGNVDCKYHGSPTDGTYLYIPIKREIKDEPYNPLPLA